MSTSYYGLEGPFTSLRLEEGEKHDRLTIWEQGANCGTLVFSKGIGRRIVLKFAEHGYDDVPPLRTHWGGKERGSVVTVNDSEMPDEATVISEYGDILTVGQVKARHGARRVDGHPTELFGYEVKHDPTV
jgi:hypothetical protein